MVDPPPRPQLFGEAPLAATGLRPAQDGAVAADQGRRDSNAAAPKPAPTEEDLTGRMRKISLPQPLAKITQPRRGTRARGRGRGRGAAAANDPIPIASAGPASGVPQQPRNHVHPNTQCARAGAASEACLGFAPLDAISLQTECRKRDGLHPPCPDDDVRGWKLFTVALRMLLYRSAGESRVPQAELDRRLELFRAGHWA